MAVYKVPQDVEADDKLIGPFSFRQFVYLLIVAGAGGIAYFLSQLFLPLLLIPMPIIIFFGALALPLRKDQPMETYLAAIVSFYLKPRRRMWNPDGTQNLVEITAPRVVEVQRTKGLSQDEAEKRLSYLASVVDSEGWAVRGADGQQQALANSALTSDAFYDAQKAEDILDEGSGLGRNFDTRLDQSTAKHHQELLARFHQAQAAPTPSQPPISDPYASLPQATSTPQTEQLIATPQSSSQQPAVPAQPQPSDTQVQPAQEDNDIHLTMNPYPSSMHQSVIAPAGSNPPAPNQNEQPPAQPQTTSEKQVSPDIMNLANNSDLSVETIAREAKRLEDKKKLTDDEVVISLR